MMTMVKEVIARILFATTGPLDSVHSLVERRSPAKMPAARMMAGRLKNMVGSNGKGSVIRKFLVHVQIQQAIGVGDESFGLRKC